MKYKDYQLRHAAGMYWLLDMKQEGLTYKKPLCLNEGGAYIWERIQEGMSKEQIVQHLVAEFDLFEIDARQDVDLFYGQLQQHQITL